MAHGCVAADEDELLEGLALACFFEEPEHAFDGDIHDGVWRFLAGGQVENVGDASHGFGDDGCVADGALHDLKAGTRGELSLMTQRSHLEVAVVGVSEEAIEKMLTDFAGGTGDEQAMRHEKNSRALMELQRVKAM